MKPGEIAGDCDKRRQWSRNEGEADLARECLDDHQRNYQNQPSERQRRPEARKRSRARLSGKGDECGRVRGNAEQKRNNHRRDGGFYAPCKRERSKDGGSEVKGDRNEVGNRHH
jgi:hypothetical protein